MISFRFSLIKIKIFLSCFHLYPISFLLLQTLLNPKIEVGYHFHFCSDVTWFFDGKRIDPPPEIVVEEPLTSNTFPRENTVSHRIFMHERLHEIGEAL